MANRIASACIGVLARLRRDNTAGVGTIAALSLPVVLGAAGLAFDLNRGFEQRVFNQRAADLGALGAAMACQTATQCDDTLLTSTAQDIAVANGLSSEEATVTAAVLHDFPAANDEAVLVRVTSELPYTLARVVGVTGNYKVVSDGIASLSSSAPFEAPCFLALSTGNSAITVSGGASIDAPDCAIAAAGSIQNNGTLIRGSDIIAGEGDISVDWGALEANALRFGGRFNKPEWNNNVPPADKRINQATALFDPWAQSSELADARDQLGDHASMPTLGDPATPSGSNWNFNWSPASPVAAWRQGTSGNYIVPPGNYTIGRLEVGGGINVTFQDGSNITVANGVAIGGGSNVDFGNANLYVNGGFDSGSNGVTIGDGDLWIGRGNVRFQGTNHKGDGNVIINATLSLGGGQRIAMGEGNHHFGAINMSGGGNAMLGDGDFTAVSGVQIAGNSELAIGDGNVIIGAGSGGNAIHLSGSARFFMGNGEFSADGHIDTQGGSRLVFGETSNRYINGNMNIRGSVLFAPGRYTINGDFNNGTGGTTWPYTSSQTGLTYGSTLKGVSVSGYDMAGVDVTFILGGTFNLAGGARTKLIASTSSVPGAQIADMLVHSQTSSNTNWGGGSANRFAGVVYLPNSVVTMSGGNTSLDDGQCFTLVADRINASGGAASGSSCQTVKDAYGGGGSATSIQLIR